MNRLACVAAACLLFAVPVANAATPVAGGVEAFVSDDADDTSVQKFAVSAFSRYADAGHYRGLTVERARIRPLGDSGWTDHRAYLRLADTRGELAWNAKLGTDGHTLLGNAALVRDRAWRQEYFVEREILETRAGRDGRYATFAGAAFDIPLDARGQQVTLLAGVQEFSGDNVRTHLRAVYSLPLVADWGLGMQLRARSFHNSHPRELDYYSPRRFDELLPVLRLRRFHHRWMFAAAAGVGRQREADADWRAARLAELTVESPRTSSEWYLRAHLLYSNTPVGNGVNYGYRQLDLQLVRAF